MTGDYGDATTRTLLAVMSQRRPNLRTVAKATRRSNSTAYSHLQRLCDDDLIAWEAAGALRPLVRVVRTFP